MANFLIKLPASKYDQTPFFDGKMALETNTTVRLHNSAIYHRPVIYRKFFINFTHPNLQHPITCEFSDLTCGFIIEKDFQEIVRTHTEKCEAIFNRHIREELAKAKTVNLKPDITLFAQCKQACEEFAKTIQVRLAPDLKQAPLLDIDFTELNLLIITDWNQEEQEQLSKH